MCMNTPTGARCVHCYIFSPQWTPVLSRPVASIGAGGQLPPLRVVHYQLTLANLQAHLYSLAGSPNYIALQSAPTVGAVTKVGMVQQNIL